MAERNKYNLSPAARQARLEYNREYQRKRRAEHPDYDKQHREANREQYQEAVRKYKAKKLEEDPEHFAKKLRKFREDNPEKSAEYEKTKWERKARQMENITVTANKVTVTAEPGQKVCISCGGFFKPKRKTGTYCSDKCRVNYNRKYK